MAYRHLMDTLTAEQLLETLRKNTPDPHKTIEQLRQDFTAFYEKFQPPNITTKQIQLKGFSCYQIDPKTRTQPYVLLFMHGGGFTMGSTQDHIGIIHWLANLTESPVFSVDYRLSPEHVFPQALEDCLTAYDYLNTQGYEAKTVIPIGISAGGTLVLSLLLKLRESNKPLPKLACCLSPAVSLLFEGESTTTNQNYDWITKARLDSIKTIYLKPMEDPKMPLISPLYADLHGLCDLYIQFGDHELLRDDILDFIKKAKTEGVNVQEDQWKKMFHCWQIFSEVLPEGQQALIKLSHFIRNTWNI